MGSQGGGAHREGKRLTGREDSGKKGSQGGREKGSHGGRTHREGGLTGREDSGREGSQGGIRSLEEGLTGEKTQQEADGGDCSDSHFFLASTFSASLACRKPRAFSHVKILPPFGARTNRVIKPVSLRGATPPVCESVVRLELPCFD